MIFQTMVKEISENRPILQPVGKSFSLCGYWVNEGDDDFDGTRITYTFSSHFQQQQQQQQHTQFDTQVK